MKENEKIEQSSTKDRILLFISSIGITQRKFEELCSLSNGYINNIRKSIKPSTFDEKIAPAFPQLNKLWLLHGEGVMINIPKQIQPTKEVDTVDRLEIPDLEDTNLESLENSFGNRFIKLDTGGYLMYMPLFEWDVAASLLDNDGDTRHPDYEDVAQHVTIVNEPLKGKYSAFRIKGGSMEGTEVNRYIPDGSIVWGRELQRIHWSDKLRINKHPLWIIGSTEFGRPTLKEIKLHDLETSTIFVDSWNPSKEYAHNVAISLNTVKMLYYIMKVESSISDF